jgi:hypothetical protein
MTWVDRCQRGRELVESPRWARIKFALTCHPFAPPPQTPQCPEAARFDFNRHELLDDLASGMDLLEPFELCHS